MYYLYIKNCDNYKNQVIISKSNIKFKEHFIDMYGAGWSKPIYYNGVRKIKGTIFEDNEYLVKEYKCIEEVFVDIPELMLL